MTLAAPTSNNTGRVRLHITPFNPDLYEKVVPASAKAAASNISYHAVQTFPDRGFGFVELPAMAADKLKKKLNGSTLKGMKVKAQEAKQERKRKGGRDGMDDEAEGEEERRARKKAKKEKKKREEGVVPGYELEDGRHVKRGWAEEKGKKGNESLEGKKMLFKTTVPPNAISAEDKSKPKSKEKKEKKEKKVKSGKAEKIVKEFSKSRKPVLDVAVESKPALTYEEGKGWVDDNGDVVEAEPPSKKRRRQLDEARRARETAARDEEAAARLREQVLKEVPESPKHETERTVGDAAQSDSSGSDEKSEIGSSSEDEDEASVESSVQQDTAIAHPVASSATAKHSTPPVAGTPREIHPLEALYKRPASSPSDERKPKLKPLDTSFSFFDTDANADDDELEVTQPAVAPQTPHTKQDMEWRSLRSAAPTPDTAAIGKKFKFPFEAVDGEDEESQDVQMEDAYGGPVQDSNPLKAADKPNGEQKEESEFRKWFYEKRGDNNRAWKKMRRDAKKQQRQRENRRLSRRVV